MWHYMIAIQTPSYVGNRIIKIPYPLDSVENAQKMIRIMENEEGSSIIILNCLLLKSPTLLEKLVRIIQSWGGDPD